MRAAQRSGAAIDAHLAGDIGKILAAAQLLLSLVHFLHVRKLDQPAADGLAVLQAEFLLDHVVSDLAAELCLGGLA